MGMRKLRQLCHDRVTTVSIVLFVLIWVLWSIWQCFVLPVLRIKPLTALILDSIIVKGILWAVIPFALLKGCNSIVPLDRRLFLSKVPILPCLVAVCVSAAFLHTVRMLNGLMNTHVIFDFEMVILSIAAGVIEEIGFRGCIFNVQEKAMGFLPAFGINGLMFLLFHYPELFRGAYAGLISLRALMLFVIGLLFCWMFKRWKSLPMLIIVHISWNIMSYLFCLA